MGWGIAMMVAIAIFVVLLVVAAIFVVRQLGSTPSRDSARSEEALRVLEERLAEGQIDVEEYRRRRSVLQARD